MASSKAAGQRDAGADTVVGFVLVTGISLVMMSVVMLMGAPALEQVQSRQQLDAMVGDYHRLDRGVSTLLSGAPAGTTPAWQVSMADGSLSLDRGGEHLWIYVANRHQEDKTYEFWFGDYADGDDQLTIYNDGPDIGTDGFQVEAVRWEAGEDKTREHSERTRFDEDTTYSLEDHTDFELWHLTGNTTQLKLKDLTNEKGNKTVAQAWIIDAGALEWELSGSSTMRLFYQNTGIVADIDDGYVLHNSPRMRSPEVDTNGDVDEVFVRIVKLEGAVAVGGRSTSEILLSSQGNHARYTTSNASQVQLYPPTRLTDAWQRHLTNEAAGFVYDWMDTDDQGTKDPADVLTGDEGVAYSPGSGDIETSIVETIVRMSRSGGG